MPEIAHRRHAGDPERAEGDRHGRVLGVAIEACNRLATATQITRPNLRIPLLAGALRMCTERVLIDGQYLIVRQQSQGPRALRRSSATAARQDHLGTTDTPQSTKVIEVVILPATFAGLWSCSAYSAYRRALHNILRCPKRSARPGTPQTAKRPCRCRRPCCCFRRSDRLRSESGYRPNRRYPRCCRCRRQCRPARPHRSPTCRQAAHARQKEVLRRRSKRSSNRRLQRRRPTKPREGSCVLDRKRAARCGGASTRRV
jgi:hypothetical protein